MEDSTFVDMRARARFDADLKATYRIKGPGTQHQECRIANLSASGATACFPRTENLQKGAVVVIDIAIPNTIMRIATEAEIMWTRQRFNELISGIRFTDLLSENMIRQLVKKTP